MKKTAPCTPIVSIPHKAGWALSGRSKWQWWVLFDGSACGRSSSTIKGLQFSVIRVSRGNLHGQGHVETWSHNPVWQVCLVGQPLRSCDLLTLPLESLSLRMYPKVWRMYHLHSQVWCIPQITCLGYWCASCWPRNRKHLSQGAFVLACCLLCLLCMLILCSFEDVWL